MQSKPATLGALVGILVIISLLLAACSVPSQNTIPPATPTLPALTSTFLASPTVLSAFPNPAGYAWNPVITGLELPVDIQNAGDGSGRLFIVEKPGRILILKGGALLSTPFLDISAKVGSRNTEQGLLGLAFHPHYSQNSLFYLNYTDESGNTVIARFQASANSPVRPTQSVKRISCMCTNPMTTITGGGLAFGPDG